MKRHAARATVVPRARAKYHLRRHALLPFPLVVRLAQGKDLVHVVGERLLVAARLGLLDGDPVLHLGRQPQVRGVLHVHPRAHKRKGEPAAHRLLGELVPAGLGGDERDPVLLVNHLQDLVPLGLRQHDGCRAGEIEHRERIHGVKVRACAQGHA